LALTWIQTVTVHTLITRVMKYFIVGWHSSVSIKLWEIEQHELFSLIGKHKQHHKSKILEGVLITQYAYI